MNKLSDNNETLETDAKENSSIENQKFDMGIANGSIPSDFYSYQPCTIGYSYIRFEVDGKIRPCCIAKYEIGHIDNGDWQVTWHSSAWNAFRKKLLNIHLEKFHLTDTNWLFCQQCSHLPINQRNNKLLKEK